jgi:hypothetical protein
MRGILTGPGHFRKSRVVAHRTDSTLLSAMQRAFYFTSFILHQISAYNYPSAHTNSKKATTCIIVSQKTQKFPPHNILLYTTLYMRGRDPLTFLFTKTTPHVQWPAPN